MIQYLQLSLFDVMPDAEVDSLIEQLPCRVAKSRIRSAKPKLPYFHWRITNIYDYADHPIDCLKGPYEKTGFALRLYPKGWGVYTGAIQHVSKRNVFAMLEWLHEQQAKPPAEIQDSLKHAGFRFSHKDGDRSIYVWQAILAKYEPDHGART